VKKICNAAKVPQVTAHGMRRLHRTQSYAKAGRRSGGTAKALAHRLEGPYEAHPTRRLVELDAAHFESSDERLHDVSGC
jgi:hypothetical protein